MAGTINNKNAEKWTEEKAIELAQLAESKVSVNCYFIAKIAQECGVYRELFHYLMNKFNDNEIVFNSLKRMYNKAETIIWEKSAEGKIDKTIGIFALKSLHGLFETSKQMVDAEVKTNHSGSIGVSEWIQNRADSETDAES